MANIYLPFIPLPSETVYCNYTISAPSLYIRGIQDGRREERDNLSFYVLICWTGRNNIWTSWVRLWNLRCTQWDWVVSHREGVMVFCVKKEVCDYLEARRADCGRENALCLLYLISFTSISFHLLLSRHKWYCIFSLLCSQVGWKEGVVANKLWVEMKCASSGLRQLWACGLPCPLPLSPSQWPWRPYL